MDGKLVGVSNEAAIPACLYCGRLLPGLKPVSFAGTRPPSQFARQTPHPGVACNGPSPGVVSIGCGAPLPTRQLTH